MSDELESMRQQYPAIRRGMQRIAEVSKALADDFNKCNDVIQQLDEDAEVEQFWRRALTRATFAMIEGMTYTMKQLALENSKLLGIHFSQAELALLLEENYELDEKCRAVARTARIPITKNVRFAFRAFARSLRTDYEIDVSRAEWDTFKRTLKIRDRLMHPKSSADVEVSDDELFLVSTTWVWFTSNMRECVERCITSINSWRIR